MNSSLISDSVCSSNNSRHSENNVQRPRNERIENKCVVRGVLFDDIIRSAEEYILTLALNANCHLAPNDISSAEIQQHAIGDNGLCSIFVIFKTFEKRKEFLKIRELPRGVQIIEALNKHKYALFKQAEVLYRFGYSFVYHQRGQVYAKRNVNSEPMIIKCHQDIRRLKGN